MLNIEDYLNVLVQKQNISEAGKNFLLGYFKKNMKIADIAVKDIEKCIAEFSKISFDEDLRLSDDWLQNEFHNHAPFLLAEASVFAAITKKMDAIEVSKIFFIFTQVSDRLAESKPN